MNTVPKKLDLLSKAGDKKTDCDSKLSIKILTKRSCDEMCVVDLCWNHNHSVNSYHQRSFCPILPSTKGHLKITLKKVCLVHKHSTIVKETSSKIPWEKREKFSANLQTKW